MARWGRLDLKSGAAGLEPGNDEFRGATLKIKRGILGKSGWHVTGDAPVQLAVKFGQEGLGPAHYHRTMSEYFFVLDGELWLTVGEEEVHLEQGDLLIVDPGEPHQMLRRSPDARYLLLMPKATPNDKVVLESDTEGHAGN